MSIDDRFTSRDDLKRHIMSMLGYPQQEVELTDEQLDHAINRAVKIYKKFAGEGTEREFLVIETKADQSEYEVPERVRHVLGVIEPRVGGIRTLFTIEHSLYMSGQLDFFNNFDMVSYATAMNYLGTMEKMMGENISVQFSDAKDEVTIYPPPGEDGTVFLQVYSAVESPEILESEFVVNYSLGLAKVVWGNLAAKYDTELPDGSSITLDELKDEGKEEMEQAYERLRNVDEPPPQFFVG